MTDEVTQAIRDSLLMFWAAGSSAARQNKEASPQAFDREAARLMALINARANQPPAQDGLVEALRAIEQTPNYRCCAADMRKVARAALASLGDKP